MFCPVCLSNATFLINNRQSRRGLYCETCNSHWLLDDTEYFKTQREIRYLVKLCEKVYNDLAVCCYCKIEKSFNCFISNKMKPLGISERCKDCDKLLKIAYQSRHGELEVKQYHRDRSAQYAACGKGKVAVAAYDRRSAESLSDTYIKKIIRSRYAATRQLVTNDDISQKEISLIRAIVSFKRTKKELSNETV